MATPDLRDPAERARLRAICARCLLYPDGIKKDEMLAALDLIEEQVVDLTDARLVIAQQRRKIEEQAAEIERLRESLAVARRIVESIKGEAVLAAKEAGDE